MSQQQYQNQVYDSHMHYQERHENYGQGGQTYQHNVNVEQERFQGNSQNNGGIKYFESYSTNSGAKENQSNQHVQNITGPESSIDIKNIKQLKEYEKLQELEDLEAQRLYCIVCDIKFAKESQYWIHNRGLAHYSKLQEKEGANEQANERPEPQVEVTKEVEKIEKEPDWSYCAACDLSFFSEGTFLVHTQTESHKEYQEEWDAKNPKDGHPLAQKNSKWAAAHEKDLTPFDIGKEGSQIFYCEVCDLSCTGAKCFQSHLGGQKHAKNVRKAQNVQHLKKTIQDLSTGTGNKKKNNQISSIQTELERCSLPLIGVDYMTEFQKDDPSFEPKFTCDLCEAKMDPRQVINHITGIRHRTRYFKFHAMKYYNELWSLRKAQKTRLAEKHAFKIEKEEGRRNIRVKVQWDLFNDGSTVGQVIEDEKQFVDITGGNVRNVEDLPGWKSKDLLSKYKEEKSDDDDEDEESATNKCGEGTSFGQNMPYPASSNSEQHARSVDPYYQSNFSDEHYMSDYYGRRDQYNRDSGYRYEHDTHQYARDSYSRGSYDRDPYYSRDQYYRDPYYRDPYYDSSRQPYDRDPYMDRYRYSDTESLYRNAYDSHYSGYSQSSSDLCRNSSSSDPYLRPPPEHYNISSSSTISNRAAVDVDNKHAMAKAEESLQNMLDEFKSKNEETKKQAEINPSQYNIEAADASETAFQKISSQATQWLSKMGECQVNNEKDAQMALQMSNALTQALLGYRIKHLPEEIRTDYIQEKLSSLSQTAKGIIHQTSTIVTNNPGSAITSNAIQHTQGTSNSVGLSNSYDIKYTGVSSTSVNDSTKSTSSSFASTASALKFLSHSYLAKNAEGNVDRNSAGYSVPKSASSCLTDPVAAAADQVYRTFTKDNLNSVLAGPSKHHLQSSNIEYEVAAKKVRTDH